MNTRLVAVTAIILLFLSLTFAALIPTLVDKPEDPNETGEDDSLFTLNVKHLTENFTIVVLPDTQGYTKAYPWLFDNQTQWIVDNKEALNIVFVTHLGDFVDSYDNITQWEFANSSMSKLYDNIRWAGLPGNHDGFYGEPNNLTSYHNYFGYKRFSNKSWYGGTYKAGDNTNSYQLFSAGGDDYLIFHLQYNPSDDVLFWASNVIGQHPEKRVIVSTHDYVMGPFDCDRRSDIGERIWHSLIKHHADQIFLVLCGHASTQSRLTDTVNGHVVNQLLSDFQNGTNIESGWLRILEFCPAQDKIFVKTYSPSLKEYNTDPANEFTLDYNMTGELIAVFSNCSVSQLIFDQQSSLIGFEVSGETGATGYCNVTVPKTLLNDPWNVTLDDVVWSYTSSENTTHSSLYFTYTYSTPIQVAISGS